MSDERLLADLRKHYPDLSTDAGWNPLRDWNHTMVLANAARQPANRFDLFWRSDTKDWEADFAYVAWNDDPQRAICLAALAVKRH